MILAGVILIIFAIFILTVAIVALNDPDARHPGGLFLLAILVLILEFCATGKGVHKINIPASVRTITITAEDGREIYSFTGKVNPSVYTRDHYLIFVDEAGNKQIVKWGATDTLIISENDEKSS